MISLVEQKHKSCIPAVVHWATVVDPLLLIGCRYSLILFRLILGFSIYTTFLPRHCIKWTLKIPKENYKWGLGEQIPKTKSLQSSAVFVRCPLHWHLQMPHQEVPFPLTNKLCVCLKYRTALSRTFVVKSDIDMGYISTVNTLK